MRDFIKKNLNAIVFFLTTALLIYVIVAFDWVTIKENAGVLSPIILGFGIPMVNSYNKKREMEYQQKLEDRDKERDNNFNKITEAIQSAIMQRLDGIDLTLIEFEKVQNELKTLFGLHVGKDDFIDKFSNQVRGRSNNILISTQRCDQKFKTILSSWCELIILFGIMYYKDKESFEDTEELKDHLEQDMKSKIDLFYSSCDMNINGLRKHNGKEIRFSKLLRDSMVHNRTSYLISILADNGFSNKEDIIKTFKNYIKDFFNLYFTAVTVWELCEVRKLTDAA